MKRSVKKPDPFWGGLLLSLGFLLFFIDSMWEIQGTVLSSTGGSLMGIGLVWLFRGWHWGREEKTREYAQKAREEAAAKTDERMLMLKDKAGRLTLQIMLCFCCAILVVALICQQLEFWRPYIDWLGISVAALAYLAILLNVILFRILSKRM